MTRMESSEVCKNLAKTLDRVQHKGRRIVIQRHGKPPTFSPPGTFSPTHPGDRLAELLPDAWFTAHPNTRRKVAS